MSCCQVTHSPLKHLFSGTVLQLGVAANTVHQLGECDHFRNFSLKRKVLEGRKEDSHYRKHQNSPDSNIVRLFQEVHIRLIKTLKLCQNDQNVVPKSKQVLSLNKRKSQLLLSLKSFQKKELEPQLCRMDTPVPSSDYPSTKSNQHHLIHV